MCYLHQYFGPQWVIFQDIKLAFGLSSWNTGIGVIITIKCTGVWNLGIAFCQMVACGKGVCLKIITVNIAEIQNKV